MKPDLQLVFPRCQQYESVRLYLRERLLRIFFEDVGEVILVEPPVFIAQVSGMLFQEFVREIDERHVSRIVYIDLRSLLDILSEERPNHELLVRGPDGKLPRLSFVGDHHGADDQQEHQTEGQQSRCAVVGSDELQQEQEDDDKTKPLEGGTVEKGIETETPHTQEAGNDIDGVGRNGVAAAVEKVAEHLAERNEKKQDDEKNDER